MHTLVHTIPFHGINTIRPKAQANIANGLPAIAIIVLADKVVAESRERVRAGIIVD